jgi:hypothetical protein
MAGGGQCKRARVHEGLAVGNADERDNSEDKVAEAE